MRERPILFSAPLVRLLAGTKSITRRPCKVQPEPWKAHHLEGGCQRGDWKPAEMADGTWDLVSTFAASQVPGFGRCPYGALGERLWVRETLRRVDSGGRGERWVYGADETTVTLPREDPRVPEMISWAHHKEGDVCTSIHMPRWASRILLEVTDVRVERAPATTEDVALVMRGLTQLVSLLRLVDAYPSGGDAFVTHCERVDAARADVGETVHDIDAWLAQNTRDAAIRAEQAREPFPICFKCGRTGDSRHPLGWMTTASGSSVEHTCPTCLPEEAPPGRSM